MGAGFRGLQMKNSSFILVGRIFSGHFGSSVGSKRGFAVHLLKNKKMATDGAMDVNNAYWQQRGLIRAYSVITR